ncbi:Sterol-4-alpha-carboxylate 3-dehydrogenase, decarboxylating [Neofusicoccum parvum]|uniref:Sterol-4-alpha-carboxylate 3-dehydrogenase, decarboxylating n=1 Tax=Neofusicoccum parvum TaxID=310453 RepID=A0ACB5S6G4_9PEZI|nr:Sterol-4-alpha-carboxylate 3-dehydrogenase, decarboxylating [Neofusicoccum parvum]
MPPEEHILITGGAGFLGRYILHAFLAQHPSHRYTVLDISPPSTTPPPAFPPNHADVAFLQTDVRDAPAVRAALKAARPTAVVHAAGIVPAGAARYSRRRELRAGVFGVNVEGTRNVLEAARACGSVRAFVYTSSATVVGDDLGRTHAETLVLAANDPSTPFLTTALRPSVLFGPGDANLLPPIHALIAGPPGATSVVLGDGLNLYDFTYVANAADAHVLAALNLLRAETGTSVAGLPVFVTNAAPVPFRDFCRAVWARFGHVPRCEVRVPAPAARALARVADAAAWAAGGREWSLSAGSVEDAVGVRYVDGRRARDLLGYVPRVGLAEGDYKRVLAEMDGGKDAG